MALTQGLLSDYWRRYNQRRALTGLPSSYQETRGAMDSILGTAAQKDLEEARLRNQYSLQNRQLTMQEKAQKDADRAATVSGVSNLASVGTSGYLGYKYLNKPPGALESAMANYYGGGQAGLGATAPVTGADITAATGSFGAPSYTAPALTAPGYTSPTLAGAGSGGAGMLSGAGSGAVAPSTAYTGATGTAAYGSAEGAGAAGVLGAESGGSLLGTVGGPAALAGAGGAFIANKLGIFGADKPDTGAAYAAGGVGGAAAGALAGAYATSWSGPGAIVGAAIGGIVGLLSSGDSVICSELLRQKRITERERTVCVVFRFRHIPDDMFMAYLEWAKPHVKAMRRGGWRNRIRLPFAHAFVGYMLAIHGKRRPSFMEKTVWNYAWCRCENIARLQASGEKAVA